MPFGRPRHGIKAQNVDAALSREVESRLLPKEEAEFYHSYHVKQSPQMKSAANCRLQKSNGAVIRVTAVLD